MKKENKPGDKPKLVFPIADPANWRSHLLRGRMRSDGTPGAILAHHYNVDAALRYAPEWTAVLAFNEFSQRVEAINPTPWGFTGNWTDTQDTKAAMWMQSENINAGVEVVGGAIQQYAHDAPFHPVREYLESLQWDGIERIDNWLSFYLGCRDPNVDSAVLSSTPYLEAVGARWLISAVARIFRPGCKVDCILILEGPQGSYKSTALRTLTHPWFTDEMADLGSKDSSMQTFGVWLIELAELDSMSKAEVGRVKAFISRGTDRFRPPYGKHVVDGPRQCIFAGSVNHSAYLRDETGGRRFWPVEVQRVRVDQLAADRDQLWAEAVSRFRGGSCWWLDNDKLDKAAELEQFERYEGDVWDDPIRAWLALRTDVSIAEVLEGAIDKAKDQWTQTDHNRVSRILTSLKWTKFLDRDDKGKRQRRWKK